MNQKIWEKSKDFTGSLVFYDLWVCDNFYLWGSRQLEMKGVYP